MTTTTTQNIIRFAVGDQLSARSLCDYDCIFRFEVLSRTAKFVTVKYFNQEKRVGIKVRDGREYCYPLGTYSMAVSVHAQEAEVK
jgi:hypothetical protein